MASAALTRLQEFFRSLFQFDLADLDFGLYRLFRIEQAAIEGFIDVQLPCQVEAAFAQELASQHAHLHAELESVVEEVRTQLALDAILPSGELKAEYRQSQMRFVSELAARYDAARESVQAFQDTEDAQIGGVRLTFVDPHGLHHGGLAGNADKFAALAALWALSDHPKFQARRIQLDGCLLTTTPLAQIADAAGRSQADLECDYPLLFQEGMYVERLLSRENLLSGDRQ